MKAEYALERKVDEVLDLLTPGNRLVMRACMTTGLRVGDVLRLRPSQLRPQFYITEQKTGKRRRVNLPAALLDDLRAASGPEWVFSGRDWRKHRTRQAVWKDVRRACAAMRMPEHFTPHSTRKCYAVALLAKYGDLARVQRALNHSSPAVTAIYALADKLPDRRRRRRRG